MEPLTLPLSAERVIPHRPPMRLVDRLIECDPEAGSGTVEAIPRGDGFFTVQGGLPDPLALLEMIAQAFAAVKGYENLVNGRPVRGGYLVGIRQGRVEGNASPGERLRISVQTEKVLGDFSVARGVVALSGRPVASATIKVWSPA